jgi:hypothetical protein
MRNTSDKFCCALSQLPSRYPEYWSQVRRAGLPTADPQALDSDCILAAQAVLLGDPGNDVVIATTNVGHLGRFPRVRAESWEKIVP